MVLWHKGLFLPHPDVKTMYVEFFNRIEDSVTTQCGSHERHPSGIILQIESVYPAHYGKAAHVHGPMEQPESLFCVAQRCGGACIWSLRSCLCLLLDRLLQLQVNGNSFIEFGR
jgi:hypothetical protein